MATSVIDCVLEFRKHYKKWENCNDCGLGAGANRHVLRPRGFLPCDLLFVGMAPGQSENTLGFPMMPDAPSGDIIDGWILESGAIDFRWCIQNLTACISRNGKIKVRDPLPYEINCCQPRLIEFVRMAAPGQIVLLGGLAQKHFPKSEFRECQFLNLPHPASLLRTDQKGKNLDVALMNSRAIGELRRFVCGV